ncbi:MAG: TonB-dependent receptor, partial [Acidobacteria bacterium]|nr:TonB-dependent receptor [Acidobacteriota bacterium]
VQVPGLVEFGTDAFLPRSTLLNTYQLLEKLTYTQGAHSVRVGVDFARYQMNGFSGSRKYGRLRFNNYRDFLEGRTPRDWEFLVPGTGEMTGWRQNSFAFYVQDDMKLRPSFTLNLGLRWEFVTSPTEVAGRIANVRHFMDPGPTIGEPFFKPPKTNLGPRVGLAWDPFGAGQTAVRAGFGMFTQQLSPGYWTLPAVQNEPFFIRTQVSRPSFPNLPFTVTGTLPPSQPTPFEFEPKGAYMMNWNLTLQHQLGGSIMVSGSYLGSRGVHLGSHVNFNIREFTVLPDGRKFWAANAPRLNPAFGSVSFKHFNMDSVYHSLQLRMTKRFSQGLQFQTSYAFGKNIDNASESQGGGSAVIDPFMPGLFRSLSDLDVRHSFNFNYSYDLPLFQQQAGAVAAILGHWRLSGIVTLATGNPNSVISGFNADRSGSDSTGGTPPRTPDLVSGADNNPVVGDGRNPDRYLEPSPFRLQQVGTFGNLGRNTVIGPGVANFDISLVKLIPLGESRQIQFRSEFFNLFNRSNYAQPNATVFNNASGVPSGNFGRINELSTTPRQIQFALKFVF